MYGIEVVRYYVIELGLSDVSSDGTSDWNFEGFWIVTWFVWVVGLKIITN